MTLLRRVLGYFGILKPNVDKVEAYLKSIPRYVPGTLKFQNRILKFADSASLLSMYKEIFKQGIYQFNSTSESPLIIDAGANVGMSVLYFKKLYPKAHIIAFEPDSKIYSLLLENINSFGLDNVLTINKGLWNLDGELKFNSDGADAGRISDEGNNLNIIDVTRLNSYLTSSVDFLKVDIEGAEMVVLKDCEDLLCNVKNIFIEYHSFLGEEQKLDELLAILKTAGFRYSIRQHGVVSKQPFIKIKDQGGMDILLNISAFRSV